MIEPGAFRALKFREASAIWFDNHSRRIGVGTIRHYRDCIRALMVFFAELPLEQIHIGHFEQYQEMRLAGTGGLGKAGPVRSNHELNALSQMLRRAGLWHAISDHYRPLPLPKAKIGVALESDEQDYLFEISSTRPKWRVAYLASLVTVNTTAGPGEILGLMLGDITLSQDPQIHIRQHVKNKHRDRWIPLNETAEAAIRELVEIAGRKGSHLPAHYLLPHRADRSGLSWDPARPMYGWRKAWNAMRAEAAKKYPRLATLRMYDLRHDVITRLLEDEAVSEQTVITLAGWVSQAMKKTYSHIRNKPLRSAVDRLAQRKPPQGETPAALAIAFRRK